MEERIRAKVMNLLNPGEHIQISFNGRNYGYQADEEYDMPKYIFDYLNSIERTKWVQDKNDRVPRQVKTKRFLAIKVDKPKETKKNKLVKEIVKDEETKKELESILND